MLLLRGKYIFKNTENIFLTGHNFCTLFWNGIRQLLNMDIQDPDMLKDWTEHVRYKSFLSGLPMKKGVPTGFRGQVPQMDLFPTKHVQDSIEPGYWSKIDR